MKRYNILNLGAGVQSTRIFLAACRGEIRKPDVTIFADTQWEIATVYKTLDWLKTEAHANGLEIVTVTAGALDGDGQSVLKAAPPVYLRKPDGGSAILARRCTTNFKIRPIEKWIRREFLGLSPGRPVPKDVRVNRWYGISDDEASRARFPGTFDKSDKWDPSIWQMNVYPLLNEAWTADRKIEQCDFFPRREQRHDCIAWLTEHYPGQDVPRSACIACPFRSNKEWLELSPEDFETACRFDESLRKNNRVEAIESTPFVHRQLIPLRMVDFSGTGAKRGGCGAIDDGFAGHCHS